MSLLVVLLAVAAVGAGGASPGRAQPLSLDYSPYLGLACHPARHPCSRVGIAVWLPRRAGNVAVLVHGHALELRSGRGSARYGRGLFWQGFFSDRDAERMAGDPTRMLDVETFGVFPNGGRFVAHDRSPVSSGYC